MNILHVDDHPLVRSGLRDLLAEIFPQSRFYESPSPDHAIKYLNEGLRFDLVFLDIAMGGSLDAFQFARELKCSKAAVVFFTACVNQFSLKKFMSLDANAIVSKGCDNKLLAKLFSQVKDDSQLMCPEFSALHENSMNTIEQMKRDHLPLECLTLREKEVVGLTVRGMSIKEIATKLQRSDATITRHRHNILSKLGISSSRALVAALKGSNL